MREALEQWQTFERRELSKIFGTYGELNKEDDPQKLRAYCWSLLRLAQALAGVLDAMHWPRFDRANSHITDERAFEQAARHLRDGRASLAWDILQGALRNAESYQDNPTYAALGVDLRDYFRAEAEATLRVVMADHLLWARQDRI